MMKVSNANQVLVFLLLLSKRTINWQQRRVTRSGKVGGNHEKTIVMLNIDASFDENMGCGSMGAVIRDSSGAMIIASNNFIPRVVDARMAEAYALKEGLMLAQHAGCNRVIIQSDCMEVIDIMGDGGFTANLAAAMCDECNTIWLGFQEISIEHCRKEANQVAHELAKLAMISKTYCIWMMIPLVLL